MDSANEAASVAWNPACQFSPFEYRYGGVRVDSGQALEG
jgi:hypothetical protein